jgi:hypothetical protein
MRDFTLLVVAVFFVAVPPLSLAESLFDIQGILWWAQPGGDGSVGFSGVQGTDFDLEDDLGYSDYEAIPGVRGAVGRTHRLVGELLRLDISTSSTIERNIQFQDRLFRVNSDVSSDVKATLARLYYQFTLEAEPASLGLVLGGQYVDLEARAEASGVGRASASLSAGLPFIGAAVQAAPTSHVVLTAQGIGSSWDIGDVEATFFDFEATAAYRWELLHVSAGYRHLIIDAKDPGSAIRADLTFSGPIVFVGLSW